MSLAVKVIRFTDHVIKCDKYMEKTVMIGYWSQDQKLVSNQITNIDKIIKRKQIINNAALPMERGISVFCTRPRSELIVITRRQMINSPISPSNKSFKR